MQHNKSITSQVCDVKGWKPRSIARKQLARGCERWPWAGSFEGPSGPAWLCSGDPGCLNSGWYACLWPALKFVTLPHSPRAAGTRLLATGETSDASLTLSICNKGIVRPKVHEKQGVTVSFSCSDVCTIGWASSCDLRCSVPAPICHRIVSCGHHQSTSANHQLQHSLQPFFRCCGALPPNGEM